MDDCIKTKILESISNYKIKKENYEIKWTQETNNQPTRSNTSWESVLGIKEVI